jgi:hypothetical protein
MKMYAQHVSAGIWRAGSEGVSPLYDVSPAPLAAVSALLDYRAPKISVEIRDSQGSTIGDGDSHSQSMRWRRSHRFQTANASLQFWQNENVGAEHVADSNEVFQRYLP